MALRKIAHGTPDSFNQAGCRCRDCIAAGKLRIHGKLLYPGTEISVWDTPKGTVKHRYRVVSISLSTEDKLIINCVGGKRNTSRSFHLEKIAVVHRTRVLA